MGVGGDQTSVPCLICPTGSAPYLDAPSGRADSTCSHTVNVISLPGGTVHPEGSTGQTKDLASSDSFPFRVCERDVGCSSACPRSSASFCSCETVSHHPTLSWQTTKYARGWLNANLPTLSLSIHEALSEFPGRRPCVVNFWNFWRSKIAEEGNANHIPGLPLCSS